MFVLHRFLALASGLNAAYCGVFTVCCILLLHLTRSLTWALSQFLDTPFQSLSSFHKFKMRASVIILGFLATLAVALPGAYPKVALVCQSVSFLDSCEQENAEGQFLMTVLEHYGLHSC